MVVPSLTRRTLLRASVGTAAAVATSAFAPGAMAQRKADAPISVEDLMKPDDVPDIILGKADAPTTIVEYASLTCSHCGDFHNKVFPTLKEKYVETGKVRFIMRSFPRDTLDLAAFMLARCAGGDKIVPLTGVFFAKQEDWAFLRANQLPALYKIAQQAGFTKESFDKCLNDQVLSDQLVRGRDRAATVFGVDATPTFFINGKKMKDEPSVAGFDKAIAESVKS